MQFRLPWNHKAAWALRFGVHSRFGRLAPLDPCAPVAVILRDVCWRLFRLILARCFGEQGCVLAEFEVNSLADPGADSLNVQSMRHVVCQDFPKSRQLSKKLDASLCMKKLTSVAVNALMSMCGSKHQTIMCPTSERIEGAMKYHITEAVSSAEGNVSAEPASSAEQ